jgi:hypothetical protein
MANRYDYPHKPIVQGNEEIPCTLGVENRIGYIQKRPSVTGALLEPERVLFPVMANRVQAVFVEAR